MAEPNLNVFVIDDDESVPASLKMLIESSGYHVTTFQSAEDLLNAGLGENPCCLILDINLPGMSGFKLQEHLVRSKTSIPVIFITGHDRHRLEEEALGLGAVAYLRKPFDDEGLLEVLARLCQGVMNAQNEMLQ